MRGKKPETLVRQRVFELMGVSDHRPLRIATHPRIHAMLKPWEGLLDLPGRRQESITRPEYPLTQAGDFSRLPVEYQPNWFNATEIDWHLISDPKLAALSFNLKDPMKAIASARKHALLLRAGKAYSEEWRALSPEFIRQAVFRRAQGIPEEANERNSKRVVSELGRKDYPNRTPIVLDVGCGSGGTILPIARRLKSQFPEVFPRTTFAVLDVMPSAVKHVAKELQRLGVPRENIVQLKMNFIGMTGLEGFEKTLDPRERNAHQQAQEKLARLKGRISVITSGAALHHASDAEEFFKAAKRYLRPNGKVIFWDWGHSATESPSIRLHDRNRKIPGVTHGPRPSELGAITAANRGWMDLLNYSDAGKERLVAAMQRAASQQKPFNFLKWLQDSRFDLERLKQKSYGATPLFLEAHRPPELLGQAIRRAGLQVRRISYPLLASSERKVRSAGRIIYAVEAAK